jgi:diguanylate cyclase (GGDEF)-like protein
MVLRGMMLRAPGRIQQAAIIAAGVLSTLLVGYFHIRSGLAYEFHLLFILPVLMVAWFAGTLGGYGIALFSASLWYLADSALEGDQSDALPLLFNTGMRLVIFLAGVWLLTQLRAVLERESRLAREDALTGLPNRREFLEQGLRALAQARRYEAPFTAAFIDLDRFKEVNDEMGHEVGDAVLRAVADGLRAHLRASDIPGRLGGDEFALLLPDMDVAAASDYLDMLRQRLLKAMRRGGWPVTFSIGGAAYRKAPEDFDRMLTQADGLMYEVKAGGRDGIRLRDYSGEAS